MMRARRFATLLAASLVLSGIAGCEKNYNRADISADGKRIAFALNRDGGFVTEDSSEIYVVEVADDLSKVSFKRLTRNRVCDAWAAFSPDGESVLFVRGNTDAGMSVWRADNSGAQMGVSGAQSNFHHFPRFVDDDAVFFASLRKSTASDGNEIVCQILRAVDSEGDSEGELVTRELREVVAIPWNERARLWSTMPAFHEGTMYYMAARQLGASTDLARPDEKKLLLDITLFCVDLSTARRRAVCDWTFSGDLEDDAPVGMADLAICPDGSVLVCCFLPGEGFSLTEFDDRQPSTLYTVDLDEQTSEPEFVSRVYMYYPQFAPIREGDEGNRALVFLSGVGFKEEGGRSVCISDIDGNNVTTLASFPGKVMTAYTDWAWLSDERLRIFHICSEGLIFVDTDRDGSNQVKRYLPAEGMRALKRAADLDRGYVEFAQEFEYVLEEFGGNEEEEPPVGGELFHYLKNRRDDADARAHDIRLSTGDHPSVETPTSQPFDVAPPPSADETERED